VEKALGIQIMYIKKVVLENIRCFERFELDFPRLGESALIAADNGDGKTTLLRSIAMGLCDETSAGALLRDTNGELIRMGKDEGIIKITLDDGGKTYTITTKIAKTDGDFDRLRQRHYPLKKFPWERIFVCAYGANRRTEGDISYDSYLAANAVYTLFNYDYPLQNPELAIRRYAKKKKEQEEICSWLDEILMLKPRSIRLTDVGIVVRDKYGNTVPLGASADGYRSTMACICDMLGWAMLAKQKNKKYNVSGIVLFDEVEQHLHPRWQLKVMDLLHKRFPNIQFIA
jgi:predicted ATP-dependent endonuclease of OLD family